MLKDEFYKILQANILFCISFCIESDTKFFTINEIEKIEYINKKFTIYTKEKNKYIVYVCGDVLTIETYIAETPLYCSYSIKNFIKIENIENLYFKY